MIEALMDYLTEDCMIYNKVFQYLKRLHSEQYHFFSFLNIEPIYIQGLLGLIPNNLSLSSLVILID